MKMNRNPRRNSENLHTTRDFLNKLNRRDLKNIKVCIRQDVHGPVLSLPIRTRLKDPSTLVLHHKGEGRCPLFQKGDVRLETSHNHNLEERNSLNRRHVHYRTNSPRRWDRNFREHSHEREIKINSKRVRNDCCSNGSRRNVTPRPSTSREPCNDRNFSCNCSWCAKHNTREEYRTRRIPENCNASYCYCTPECDHRNTNEHCNCSASGIFQEEIPYNVYYYVGDFIGSESMFGYDLMPSFIVQPEPSYVASYWHDYVPLLMDNYSPEEQMSSDNPDSTNPDL